MPNEGLVGQTKKNISQRLVLTGSIGMNTIGKNLLEIYGSNNLRVENVFYNHDNYKIYTLKGLDKTLIIHDILAISHTAYKENWDCKVFDDGVVSENAAVAIKLDIKSIKLKHNTVIKGWNYWTKIGTD